MALKLKEDFCPNCGEGLDTSTPVDGIEAPPKFNDITICYYCAQICIFKEDGLIKKASVDDLKSIATIDYDLLKQIIKSVALIKSRKSKLVDRSDIKFN